ncbi:hypothetical protein ACLIBH_10725 [Virgibacillus sp. W0430]|uniref:hypothetical protein n=1 Tax=Virgibacillus sp. W0430 TaxID=3391580 RepID=UPI003F465824
MSKGRKLMFGWFGWSMISVLFIVSIGATMLFTNLFGMSIFTNPVEMDRSTHKKEAEEISAEMDTLVQKTRETVGEEYKEIGTFISRMHTFYNETTGYGAIQSLDWNEQRQFAKDIVHYIDEILPSMDNEKLRKDLEKVRTLAQNAQKESSVETIRELHRMFHDLDIALNKYSNYDKIWDVTETLKMNP